MRFRDPPAGEFPLAAGAIGDQSSTSTPGFSGTVTFGCTTSLTITARRSAAVTLTPTDRRTPVLRTRPAKEPPGIPAPIPGGFGGGHAIAQLEASVDVEAEPALGGVVCVLVLMAIGELSCASPPGTERATQPGNYTVTFSATVNGVLRARRFLSRNGQRRHSAGFGVNGVMRTSARRTPRGEQTDRWCAALPARE